MLGAVVSKWGKTGVLTGRANKGGGGEGGHRHTTLFVPPQIGKRTAHKSHGGREGDAVNRSADNECRVVLGNSTGDDEDDGHEQG